MIDKILAGIAAFVLIIVVAAIGYTEFSKSYITVFISLKEDQDPFVAMQNLMPMDSPITSIRQVNREKNQYILIVKTRRANKNILDWLLKNDKIDNAEVR